MPDKPKIKLSELTDIYDIEEDIEDKKEDTKVEKKSRSFDETITLGDGELDVQFEDEG